MSKRKATLASAVQPTPTVCPTWCATRNCPRGAVHETAEQHLPIAIGQLAAFLAQPDGSNQPAIVLATAQWADSPRDFLELTVDQAAQLRTILDELIQAAQPTKPVANRRRRWDTVNVKLATPPAVAR